MGVEGRDEPRGGESPQESGGATAPKVPGQADRAGKGAAPASAERSAPGEPPRSVPVQRSRGATAQEDGEAPGSVFRGPRGSVAPPSEGRSDGDTGAEDPPVGDTELVSRMRGGDTAAYDELYRRHAEAVRRYARTCCRDADTADDLTNEVFARTLQAVHSGKGPQTAVRAYLLTAVRHTAAAWGRTARREHLVEDFALFAGSAVASQASEADTLDLGADVRAMHEAEQSMVVQAFRTLPERWQTVLWHTTVEDASPQDVAPILGLTANATAVLAHRAREGLKQAYLQAHVSQSLTSGGDCARYADRLGAFARGGLRVRAERGLRKHLEECSRCRVAAMEVKDVNERLRLLLPVAVIGWFAATYSVKAAGIVGGVGAAGVGGSAAAAGGKAGAGGAASEGLGAPAKAGIAASAVTAAAAAVALVLALAGNPQQEEPPPPQAKPSAVPVEPAPQDPPVEESAPEPPPLVPAPEPEARAAAPAAEDPAPAPRPEPEPEPRPADPAPVPPPAPAPAPPSSPPAPSPAPTPTPAPTPPPVPPPPAPAPAGYQINQLRWDVLGASDEPAVRVAESSWLWQRSGLRIGGRQYGHGVTVHAPSSVTIDLNRQCESYSAVAGVDDLTMGLGAVRFAVHGDGVLLWQSQVVRGGDQAVPVNVPLAGVRTMRLVVTPESPLGAAALADWAESVIRCR
ncbi:sigma-70 family RNA polymerase sigma factor [Streptomyces sp. 549]|uniref:sigma-70 family RNA polymerase sigma factor n=1 Tax=Streptomyces sp. 549 TaxID=3049076 RepID=UPI0024C2619D|nr:sigma-70 family RNA polymerase sigma factor [Streptomyces sp. 549]MDK1472993.1 sigma-70 family RNA polymerase sigma factor [Streptomyces sp. 549]